MRTMLPESPPARSSADEATCGDKSLLGLIGTGVSQSGSVAIYICQAPQAICPDFELLQQVNSKALSAPGFYNVALRRYILLFFQHQEGVQESLGHQPLT